MTVRLARLAGLVGVLLFLTGLTGCGRIPVDTAGSLDRAAGGTLRVGMVQDEPWATGAAGARSGVEVNLVEEFARGIDAQVEWHDGNESGLVELLHAGRLDLVVGGLTAASPWATKVGLTRPYAWVEGELGPEEHVLAVRPGENALLVAVERHLHANESRVAREVGGRQP